MDCSRQAPLSMGFSRQEHRNGLSFPSPGDLPHPGTEHTGPWVQSLGGEDPLYEEMAIDSNMLTWKIPWTEEPGGLQSMGLQKSQTQQSHSTELIECIIDVQNTVPT